MPFRAAGFPMRDWRIRDCKWLVLGRLPPAFVCAASPCASYGFLLACDFRLGQQQVEEINQSALVPGVARYVHVHLAQQSAQDVQILAELLPGLLLTLRQLFYLDGRPVDQVALMAHVLGDMEKFLDPLPCRL